MKPRHSSNSDSEQIMAGIAETRAHMDETLDELSERLQPRHILDDVLDYFRSHRGSSRRGARRVRQAAGSAAGQVKHKAGEAGRAAYQQVRQHPLPALLIGAGVSLLLMDRNRDDDYDIEDETESSVDFPAADPATISPESYALPEHYAGDGNSGAGGTISKMKSKGAEWKEKASSKAHEMTERSMEAANSVKRRAAEQSARLKETARERYDASYEAVSRAAEERPLAMGLGCLALGVIAGLLLPSTSKEDEWMGATRDEVLNRTREAAQDAVDRGKHVAQTAMQAAKEEAQEQGLTPQALKEKSQAVASHVTEAARADAERQGAEFKETVRS